MDIKLSESFLAYKSFKYLKISAGVLLITLIAYLAHDPGRAPNGGTWFGYTLGAISAGLVVFLGWFGIKKRQFMSGTDLLKGWLSAHVYLGVLVIFLSLFHSGFQLGLNLHSLLWTLLVLTVLSGMYGVFCYVRYPSILTGSRQGLTRAEILLELSELDMQCRDVAMGLGDEINAAILRAAEGTQVGGSLAKMLDVDPVDCPTKLALEFLDDTEVSGTEQETALRKLRAVLIRKLELLHRLRTYVRAATLVRLWLYFHIPLSIGTLVALAAHVFAVFFYW